MAMLVEGIWPDGHVRIEEGLVERNECAGTMSARLKGSSVRAAESALVRLLPILVSF
jgi:hypothetical protein